MNIFDDDDDNKTNQSTSDKQLVVKFCDKRVIRNLINMLSSIFCDISIEFVKVTNPNDIGIIIKKVSESGNMLIDVNIKTNNLLEYFCDSNFVIGIDLFSMEKALELIKTKDQTLTLSIDKDNLKTMLIYNDTHMDEVTLISANSVQRILNSTKYETVIRIKMNEFHKMCESMEKYEYLKITMKNDKMVFCVGENYEKIIKIYHCDFIKKDEFADFESVFEIKYFIKLFARTTDSDEVKLYINEDYPLGVKLNIADIGTMIVMICPLNDN
jgi:hypothetical protein